MIQLTEQEKALKIEAMKRYVHAHCYDEVTPKLREAFVDGGKFLASKYLPQGEGWISVETPPRESGRYWCYVEEITDLGISHFQWNCCYNKENNEWSDQYLKGGRVTHYTNLLPAPPINQQKKEEV
jgi:hypothetical protein